MNKYAPQPYEGPAMKKLTSRQKKLVLEYLDSGAPLAECARRVGYKDPHHSGYQNMRLEKVQAAVAEEAERRLAGSAGLGIKIMQEIANDPTHKDRFRAATALIAGAGLAPVAKQEITVTKIDQSKERVVEELKLLAAQLGPDARRLLTNANITDAVFEEVNDLAPDGEEW